MSGPRGEFEIRRSRRRVPAAERSALLVDPGFGRVFTDHMVTISYAEGKGWYDARVSARRPIPMDPATAVLHYAQEIFEGLKAYRTADGGVTLFRPEANAQRFRDSATRMAMAQLPDELFLGSLEELIKVDQAWVPTDPEGSLQGQPPSQSLPRRSYHRSFRRSRNLRSPRLSISIQRPSSSPNAVGEPR